MISWSRLLLKTIVMEPTNSLPQSSVSRSLIE